MRRPVQGLAGQVQVVGGGREGSVAHQELDGAEIDVRFQEIGGKAVAQDVNAAPFVDAGLGPGLMEDGPGGFITHRQVGLPSGEEPGPGPLD